MHNKKESDHVSSKNSSSNSKPGPSKSQLLAWRQDRVTLWVLGAASAAAISGWGAVI